MCKEQKLKLYGLPTETAALKHTLSPLSPKYFIPILDPIEKDAKKIGTLLHVAVLNYATIEAFINYRL